MKFEDRCAIATACLPRDEYRASLERLHAEMLAAMPQAGATVTGGSPQHMLQDESRELSRWLSTTPGARLHAKEAAAAIAQPAERERLAAWIAQQRNDVPATGAEFAAAIRGD